jgi:hypothetical protein
MPGIKCHAWAAMKLGKYLRGGQIKIIFSDKEKLYIKLGFEKSNIFIIEYLLNRITNSFST